MLPVWRAVARLGCGWPDWTLIAYSPALRLAEAGAAFATPTIVHFGVALLLSAVASVPWHKIGPVSVVWGLVRLRDSIRRRRGSASESASRLPARVRRLVVSCPASVCGICNAGWIGICGSLPCAPSPVRGWCCDAAAPLCWHSQCLGRREISRICARNGNNRRLSRIREETSTLKRNEFLLLVHAQRQIEGVVPATVT